MKNQEKRDLVAKYQPILKRYLDALMNKENGLTIEIIARAIGVENPNDLSRAKMDPKAYTNWNIRHVTMQQMVERLEQVFQITETENNRINIPIERIKNPPAWRGEAQIPSPNTHHTGAAWYAGLSFKLDKEIVYQGIFEFNKEWTTVRVEYFRHGESEPQVQWGTVHPRDLYLLINIADSSEGYTKSHIILKKAEQSWKNSDFFHGVYAAPSFNSHPAAGEIILQRVASLEEARKLIHTPAPDWAAFHLHGKYLIANTPNVVMKASDFPFHHVVKDIHSITGRWQGYMQNTQDNTLQECLLQISSNGQVRLKSSLYTGSIEGKLLPLTSSSSYYINLDAERHSGVCGLFLGINLFNEDVLSGVVATLLEEDSPVNFKIILWPVGNEVDWDDLQCANIDDPVDIVNESQRYEVLREFYNLDTGIISELEGHYEIILLSHEIVVNQSHLQRLAMTIRNDGTAILTGSHKKPYNGQITHTSDIIVCKFSPESEEEMYFEFIFVPTNTDNAATYSGIYAGGAPKANMPIAGRLKLIRVDEPVSVENYPLGSQKLLDFFFEHPQHLDFFLGYHDKMVLTYKDFRDAGILPRSPSKPDEINRVAGMYYSIKPHRADDKPAFFVNPVRIYEDGRVDLLSTRKPKAYYHGLAELINSSMFCITLYRRATTPQRAISLFNIGDQGGESIQLIAGVHQAYRLNQAPRTSREVLIRLNPENCRKLNLDYDHLNYADLDAFIVQLPIDGHQDERYALFNQFDGIMSFLTGDEHNAIRLSADIPPRFFREVDYADLFFSAACQKAARLNFNQSIDYLERAQHHGFSNRTLLQQELESGALQQLGAMSRNNTLFDKSFAGLSTKARNALLQKLKRITNPENYLTEDASGPDRL
ncbi:MAG: hypothetical protein IPM81_05150 [Saprospirales bacterium]|nr:hypothetical protein [Saprospirales bacterium]